MNNRYTQIALTYVRFPGLKIAAGLAVFGLVVWKMVQAWWIPSHDWWLPEVIAGLGAVAVWVALPLAVWSVGVLVRGQFNGMRARLMPGFKGPHLLAAGVVSLAACAALGEWWNLYGASWLGGVAVITALFALIAGLAAIHWLLPALVPVLGFAWMVGVACARVFEGDNFQTPWIVQELATMLKGRAPGASALTLTSGVALLVGVGIWLAFRREELRPWRSLDDGMRQLESPSADNPLSRFFLRRRDRSIDRYLQSLALPAERGIARWRLPRNPNVNLLILGMFVAPVPVVGWLVHRDLHWDEACSFIIGMGTCYAVFGGLLLSIAAWYERRTMLPQDLLRPVTRRSMVKQMALAMLIDMVSFAWAPLLVAGVGLLGLQFSPIHYYGWSAIHQFLSSWSWELAGKTMFGATIFAVIAGLCYASFVWLIRYRPSTTLACVLTATLFAAVFAVVFDLQLIFDRGMGLGVGGEVAAAAALPILIVVMLWDAHRRWLAADIN